MTRLIAAVVAVTLCCAPAAAADEVTLIAPGGIRAAIEKLIPEFEKKSGHTVKPTFGSGGGTKQQVMNGQRFDVPIVQPPLAEVVNSGHVIAGSRRVLASVPVAIAVRRGQRHPDISTPALLKQTLLAAKSIAYPDPAGGAAAGVSFDQALKAMGIAMDLEPKLHRSRGGAAAMQALARGEVELGVTFMSEMNEPGIEIVAPLPRQVSEPTQLVGFVSTHATSPAAARALLNFLSSPAAAAAYRSSGMQPGK
jgi:molybdate transport system substrate-binding protein